MSTTPFTTKRPMMKMQISVLKEVVIAYPGGAELVCEWRAGMAGVEDKAELQFLHLLTFLTTLKFYPPIQSLEKRYNQLFLHRAIPQISPFLHEMARASFPTQSSLFLKMKERHSKKNIKTLKHFSMTII